MVNGWLFVSLLFLGNTFFPQLPIGTVERKSLEAVNSPPSHVPLSSHRERIPPRFPMYPTLYAESPLLPFTR